MPGVTYDVAVVGGGIVGLATTRELLLRNPRQRVVNLEKEAAHATHQTGRNSGVVHAGVYYRPGSLRAKLCVEGRHALRDYCADRGLPYERVGKLIVALEQRELGRLYDLWGRASANGIEGIRLLDAAEIREREPHCNGLRAIFSPETAIVDYAAVARSFAADAGAAGADMLLSTEVVAMRRAGGITDLQTTQGEVRAHFVIACAGLYADRIAAMTGSAADPQIVPFRGDYLLLAPQRRGLVRGAIYPVPDPALPFLGVHFTPRVDGSVWLGPNAVLAFAREGYSLRTVDRRDLLETLRYQGFRKLAARFWRTGAEELYRDAVLPAYVRSLQRYVPELRAEDCKPGPSGVRAQAVGADGSLVDDFAIDGGDGVLNVRNAPSPGATSSLAIARLIVDEAAQRGALAGAGLAAPVEKAPAS